MKHTIMAGTLLAILAGCTSTQNYPSVVDGTACPVQKGTVLKVQSVVIERNTETAQVSSGVELVVQLDRGTHSIIQQNTPYTFESEDAVWVVGYPDSNVYSRTNCKGKDVRVFPVKGATQ